MCVFVLYVHVNLVNYRRPSADCWCRRSQIAAGHGREERRPSEARHLLLEEAPRGAGLRQVPAQGAPAILRRITCSIAAAHRRPSMALRLPPVPHRRRCLQSACRPSPSPSSALRRTAIARSSGKLCMGGRGHFGAPRRRPAPRIRHRGLPSAGKRGGQRLRAVRGDLASHGEWKWWRCSRGASSRELEWRPWRWRAGGEGGPADCSGWSVTSRLFEDRFCLLSVTQGRDGCKERRRGTWTFPHSSSIKTEEAPSTHH